MLENLTLSISAEFNFSFLYKVFLIKPQPTNAKSSANDCVWCGLDKQKSNGDIDGDQHILHTNQ